MNKNRTYIVYMDKECSGIKVTATEITVADSGQLLFVIKNGDIGTLVAAFHKFHHIVWEEDIDDE